MARWKVRLQQTHDLYGGVEFTDQTFSPKQRSWTLRTVRPQTLILWCIPQRVRAVPVPVGFGGRMPMVACQTEVHISGGGNASETHSVSPVALTD